MQKKGEYNTISFEVDGTIRCVIPASVNMEIFHDVYEELLDNFPNCNKITIYYD